MTTAQQRVLQIQERQSQLRQRLGELAALEGEAYNDEARAEIARLERELTESEPQLRAALLSARADGEPQASTGGAPADLASRIQLREYLSGAVSGNGIDLKSAEGELNAELGLDADMIPLEALAPVDLQERADAATTVPTDVGASVAPIGQRIFAGSILDFLQVMMPTVPRGERVYPIITKGSTVETVAKGAAREATAGTITSTNLSPVRGQIRYLLQVEDLAVMDLEPALRADSRSALTEHLSNMALNGTGVAPQPSGFLKVLADPDTPPTAESKFADYLASAAARVDGLWAEGLGQVRELWGADTYKHAAQQLQDGTAVSAIDYLRSAGTMVRATSLMPATDATSKDQAGIAIATGGPGPKSILPLWAGLQVVRDNTSAAASGQIALTFYFLYQFALLRAAAYTQVALQPEAE